MPLENTYILFIVLLFPYFSFAQTQGVDTLHWQEKRQITWADFHGQPKEGSIIESEFFYTITYSVYFKNRKKLVETNAVMNRKNSWASENSRNGQTLLYNIVIFNIVELYSRKLKKALIEADMNLNNFEAMTERIGHQINQQANMMIQEFKDESKDGQLIKWAKKLKQNLEDTPKITAIFVENNIGYELSLTAGAGFLYGNTQQYLTNMVEFDITYGVWRKRQLFLMNLGVGANRMTNDFIDNGALWEKGLKTGVGRLV